LESRVSALMVGLRVEPRAGGVSPLSVVALRRLTPPAP
jgi:hypothetical protein